MLKMILSSTLFTACCVVQLFAQASKIDSENVKTIRIDPSQAKGASVSQVFEEVTFIPLETTKESIFGSIGQLRVTSANYVIWDNDTKSILIFHKNGKFKAKIKQSNIFESTDPKQGQYLYGLTIKSEGGKELIMASTRTHHYYFDLNASLVKKIKYEAVTSNDQFIDGTIIDRAYGEKVGSDSVNYELAYLKGKKKYLSFFPYPRDRFKTDQFFTAGESLTPHQGVDEFFYVRAYDYNIYKLNPNGISMAYSVLFPSANSLPLNFEYDPLYRGKRRDFFQKNPKVFYSIGGIHQFDQRLFFKVANWSWDKNEKKAFIYDLKSKEVTSISDLEADSISQFLPVTDAGVSNDFANKGFLLFDGKHFYTSYSALAFFGFKAQNDEKNRVYSSDLTKYFSSQDKSSNPVLIQLKPRRN